MDEDIVKIEELKYRLERVVSWVNNCDQKVGILLAIEGVTLSIMCTSDNIQHINNRLIRPIYEYWNTGIGNLSFINTIQIILLIIMLICIITSVFFLLSAIKGITNPKLFKEPGLTEKSLLHFESISKYDNYLKYKADVSSQSLKAIINDFQSQIYINSKICNIKFKYHKKAVCTFMAFITCFVLYVFINVIIYK